MHVAMIGTGYVGLVSGACFADFGHPVVCVDKDADKIAALSRGDLPIYEPGLQALVQSNVREGRLKFSTGIAGPVREADAVFVAVGTPSRRGDGHADLSYVYAAAREIAAALDGFTVVVTKSTVPVGTGDEVERIIREARPQADFSVVSNPEFLREGAAIRDFKHPDRIVVGAEDERAKEIMAELYRPLYLNAAPILFTGRRTAELIKYAANAFLATKITFINEIAELCEKVDVDVQEVARGIGLDNRIGTKFLHAGPGFGGSCFPKDALALIKTGHDHEAPLRIVETTMAVNDQRKRAMARQVAAALGGNLHRSAGPGRRGARLRSGRHGAGETAAAGHRLCGQRLCVRGRRRSARHRHRMGAVPGAGSGAAQDDHGPAGRGRPAQRLPARRHGEARLRLSQRRPLPARLGRGSAFPISRRTCRCPRSTRRSPSTPRCRIFLGP